MTFQTVPEIKSFVCSGMVSVTRVALIVSFSLLQIMHRLNQHEMDASAVRAVILNPPPTYNAVSDAVMGFDP